jgi:aryl-alcohol dehydrogenase-like predicted oxidoreductase
MRYSLLGRTGVKVSRLALGTMSFGGDAIPQAAESIVARARDAGVKRQAEVELLPMAQAPGLAVVPYSPTAGSLLTGKYAGGVRLGGTRFATNKVYQARYAEPSYWDAAEAFAALASQLGHKPATLAVAWTAAHPAATSVLLGARRAEQLEDTLAAADLELEPAAYARIAALTPTPAPATDRSEEPKSARRPSTGRPGPPAGS